MKHHRYNKTVPNIFIYTISSSHIHRHGIGGKLHIKIGIKVIHGLDETDTPHLKEIVHVLPPIGKALNDAEHQPQIAVDELLPCADVTFLYAKQQRTLFFIGQSLQLSGIDAADFHFIIIHEAASFPGTVSLYAVLTADRACYAKAPIGKVCRDRKTVPTIVGTVIYD